MDHAEVTIRIDERDAVRLANGRSLPSAAEFTVVPRPGSCAAVFELRPLPDAALLPILAASLGIGVASSFRRLHPRLRMVAVHLPVAVPASFNAIANLYERLTSFAIRLEPVGAVPVSPQVSGPALLLSGGKDSLYSVTSLGRTAPTRGIPAIYLAGGAELSWRTEIRQVQRVADHFGLDVRIYELHARYSSSAALLRFANRATWRELVTITLARGFGDEIFTGINVDGVARLDNPAAHLADHLSQLLPTIRALEAALRARIHMVPGEFAVYSGIRSHPLFSREGSCLSPACADTTPCNKCRGFDLYDKVLERVPLTTSDVAFLKSPAFLGDPDVLWYATFEKEENDHAA